MTRPRKSEDGKRELIVKVRMTALEKKTLLSNSGLAGLTPSDYIRSRTTGSAPLIKKATPDRSAFINALAHLGKIGSNLNQIARALNRRGDSEDLTGVSKQIIEHGAREATVLIDTLIKLLD